MSNAKGTPMSHALGLEPVIVKASLVRKLLGDLGTCYGRLPALINAEHTALERGSLEDFETAAAQKSAVVDEISSQVEHLRKAADDLARAAGKCSEGRLIGSIGDVVAIVGERLADLSEKGLAPQVLAHVYAGLKADYEAFVQEMARARPLLEKNRAVIERFKRHHEETQRFWQDVAQDATSTYNARGYQRPRPLDAANAAILSVKA